LAAARNTRAGAFLDEGDIRRALEDLEWVESHTPSHYSANTRSRAEVMRGDPKEGVRWAEIATERDPEGTAGLRSLAGAVAALGDFGRLNRIIEQISHVEGRGKSQKWSKYQAAKRLLDDGVEEPALEALRALAAEDYGPAIRLLLEHEAKSF
jgi:hypothetical protein